LETTDLKITLIQFAPAWEQKTANLDYCSKLFAYTVECDLIVLPEMFTTGFSMNVKQLAEPMDGDTVQWMKRKAGKTGAAIAGSTIIEESGKYYNRFLWVTPDGQVRHYDKRHLFALGDEHLHFTAGSQRVTLEWKGWKIRPLICYDLRFPVWSRNHDDYDLLLYVANWPSPRHHVWKNLLISRALENQCWCVAVNRTGPDGMNLNYLGDSGVIDPRGNAHWMGENDSVQTVRLSYTDLVEFREKFPILRDRDSFEIW
jgi:predicted amidohydrolase